MQLPIDVNATLERLKLKGDLPETSPEEAVTDAAERVITILFGDSENKVPGFLGELTTLYVLGWCTGYLTARKEKGNDQEALSSNS